MGCLGEAGSLCLVRCQAASSITEVRDMGIGRCWPFLLSTVKGIQPPLIPVQFSHVQCICGKCDGLPQASSVMIRLLSFTKCTGTVWNRPTSASLWLNLFFGWDLVRDGTKTLDLGLWFEVNTFAVTVVLGQYQEHFLPLP